MFLLVDNSNTRTKFALADHTGLQDFRAIVDTAELTPETIEQAISGQHFDLAIISSVVPEKAKLLASLLQPAEILNCHTDLGISIDYPAPSQIGADRLANSVAAAHHYGTPAIVVDFGTAVTFDVVDATRGYIGGVIAPGLGTMTDGLQRRTALLPSIDLIAPATAIGTSTQHAMQSGAYHGYRGLVREILTRLTAELPAPPTVVATGGDGQLIVEGMGEITRYHHELTLEGLRLIACRVAS